MVIGRSDAIDIFRVWSSRKTLLRCEVKLSRLAVTLRGRILDVSSDTLRMFSDDSMGELVVSFPTEEDVKFATGSAPESSEYGLGVSLFFAIKEWASADSVAFFEIKA
ncbi:MAG: hypothetical protein ACLQPD_14745 [Desulfomonilaceae bacterium]